VVVDMVVHMEVHLDLVMVEEEDTGNKPVFLYKKIVKKEKKYKH